MDNPHSPPKTRFAISPSAPPSPIPTGKGSRSAADPILSEYVDKSLHIPELTLPQTVRPLAQDIINYPKLVSRDKDSVTRLLRSGIEIGAFQIMDHGIPTEELRFALGNGEGIFRLAVDSCALVWRGDDHRIVKEATAVIGEQNFQILRQTMANVGKQLEGIAQELGNVISNNGEPIQLGESTLSLYRHHHSSPVGDQQTTQESGPYALSLHLLLDSTEFCVERGQKKLHSQTNPDTIFVTLGKEIEDLSKGELKSTQGKVMFKATSKSSFSIEQKWWGSNFRDVGESGKTFSLPDQILLILLAALLYMLLSYILSSN